MTGDAELLRRFAATPGEDAFTELVRRHLNLIDPAGNPIHSQTDPPIAAAKSNQP